MYQCHHLWRMVNERLLTHYYLANIFLALITDQPLNAHVSGDSAAREASSSSPPHSSSLPTHIPSTTAPNEVPSLNQEPQPIDSGAMPHRHNNTPEFERQNTLDDIKVEYHPNSGRKTEYSAFEDYKRECPDSGPVNENPWYPFAGRDDFEFAEAILHSRMKSADVDILLDIMHRLRKGSSNLTFRTAKDVEKAWEKASVFHASVSLSCLLLR